MRWCLGEATPRDCKGYLRVAGQATMLMRFWAGFVCGRNRRADCVLTKQRLIVVLDGCWRKAKEYEPGINRFLGRAGRAWAEPRHEDKSTSYIAVFPLQ